MINKLIILIFLAIFWFVLSGRVDAFFLISGFISALFALYVAVRLKLHRKIAVNGGIFKYWLWLSWQVITSSLSVTKQIWARKPKIKPGFFEVSVGQKPELWYAIFANSVTLTPGTVTVLVEEARHRIIIHSLTEAGRKDIEAGTMADKVSKVVVK